MTIRAELADGRVLEFPDGTDAAIVQATVKRVVGGAPAEPAPDPLAGVPGWQRALMGAGAEFVDARRGVRQAVTRPLNALGLVSDETMADLKKEDADAAEINKRLDSDIGGKVGRFTALASTAMLPTNTVRGAAMLGTALGALSPTENESQRLVNMLTSGALGAAGQALGSKIAGWLHGGKKGAPALSPDELSLIREAERRGYDLTPAQITKSKSAQALETQLASLPGSAGQMAERRAAQRDVFGRDLFGTMGVKSEPTVAAGMTDDIARQIGNRIENATAGIAIHTDQRLLDDLVRVQDEHFKLLSPDQRTIVRQYVDDIPMNGFTGQDYQRWRSRIGQRAQGTTDSELKGALKGIQRALDSAFDRSAPQGARDAMAEARGQYRNFKTLQPLLRGAEARGEAVSPLSVAQRVASQDNLGGELAEVARMGRLIGREGPNSGTAQNQMWQRVLTGSTPLAGAGAGYLAGGPEGAAVGGPLALAATLVGPRIGSSVYLSRALRDSTRKGAEKATAKALAGPSAFAAALRRLGQEEQPLLEALMRAGAIGLPELAGSE